MDKFLWAVFGAQILGSETRPNSDNTPFKHRPAPQPTHTPSATHIHTHTPTYTRPHPSPLTPHPLQSAISRRQRAVSVEKQPKSRTMGVRPPAAVHCTSNAGATVRSADGNEHGPMSCRPL